MRILGPVAIEGGVGSALAPKARAVLAALAWHRPLPATPEDVAEFVWGVGPPEAARKTVQAHIARLRRVLPGAIESVSGAYVLASDVEVDADAFAARVDKGVALLHGGASNEAILQLEDALSEWRGDPFPEASAGGPAGGAARQLLDLRAAAEEHLAEAMLRAGRTAAATYAMALTASLPLRERRWLLLMEALRADGRHAEALRAGSDARRALAEVGLDASPALRALESAIATHAALPDAAPSLSPLPPLRGLVMGRDGDIAAVRTHLREPGLLTIVGPGGVGKTTLAVEAARPEAPASTFFVDFATTTSGDDVVELVADATATPSSDTARSVLDAIADRLPPRPLIVIDNCEHLVNAVAPIVIGLLSRRRDLRMLATSRERLAVRGERTYRLEPLTVPAGDDVSHVAASDAGRLFLARVRELQPAFDVTTTNAAEVAALCRQLDGLPLAIELAAGMFDIASLGDIALIGTTSVAQRDLPARHRSVDAVVESSLGLLADPVQQLLEQLAVFPGWFGLKAAVEVVGDAEHAVPALANLVRASLVVADTTGVHARYRLLETIRACCLRRIGVSLVNHPLRQRHLEWVHRVVGEAEVGLSRQGQVAWIDLLEDQLADLRVALAFARERPDLSALGLDVARGLFHFWMSRGHRREGRAWSYEFAGAATEAPAPDRVLVLLQAATMAVEEDRRALPEIAGLAQALAGEDDEAQVLAAAVETMRQFVEGDIAAAREAWNRVPDEGRGHREFAPGGLAEFVHFALTMAEGHPDAALPIAMQAMEACRDRGDEHLLGTWSGLTAMLYAQSPDTRSTAKSYAAAAVAAADAVRCQKCMGRALAARASVTDDPGAARRDLIDAVLASVNAGDAMGTVQYAAMLSSALISAGRLEEVAVLNGLCDRIAPRAPATAGPTADPAIVPADDEHRRRGRELTDAELRQVLRTWK